VLDTDADLSHPDLAPNAWKNPGETAGNGLDDDGNGLVDDVHGWDWINGDGTTYDAVDGNQHGTHIAGTIGAAVDNSTGVAGTARSVRLMALKIIGPSTGTTSDAIKAIAYAKGTGAQVLNASWGGPNYSASLEDAIASSGLLFVAAAGNGAADKIGDDATTSPEYPARLTLPNLVAVAAIDSKGALASYSNYGSTQTTWPLSTEPCSPRGEAGRVQRGKAAVRDGTAGLRAISAGAPQAVAAGEAGVSPSVCVERRPR
jgi:hypothetical protein